MSTSDCYIDGSGCIVCPSTAGSPGSPSYTQTLPNAGWNAGANSIAMLDGDLTVTYAFTAAPVDTFVGYSYTRRTVGVPNALAFAIRVYTLGTSTYLQVYEKGVAVGAPSPYTLGNTIEIRRVAARVTYFNNSKPIYTSPTVSFGPMVVSSCLYTAGDSIP